MILRLRGSGDYFDPTHLLEHGLSHGFPVTGSTLEQVIEDVKARTPDQARHRKGRLRWKNGLGNGPPESMN